VYRGRYLHTLRGVAPLKCEHEEHNPRDEPKISTLLGGVAPLKRDVVPHHRRHPSHLHTLAGVAPLKCELPASTVSGVRPPLLLQTLSLQIVDAEMGKNRATSACGRPALIMATASEGWASESLGGRPPIRSSFLAATPSRRSGRTSPQRHFKNLRGCSSRSARMKDRSC